MAQTLKAAQQLAVLKAVQEMVDAKYDELRKQVMDDMLEDDNERKSLYLDDEKVGTATICFEKNDWKVTDRDEFFNWLFENGQLNETHTVKEGCEEEVFQRLSAYPWLFDLHEEPKEDFTRTFEKLGDSMIVSGTDVVVPGVVPCKPKAKYITVRGCKPQQVAPIVARIGGLDAMLLGDGSHE